MLGISKESGCRRLLQIFEHSCELIGIYAGTSFAGVCWSRRRWRWKGFSCARFYYCRASAMLLYSGSGACYALSIASKQDGGLYVRFDTA